MDGWRARAGLLERGLPGRGGLRAAAGLGRSFAAGEWTARDAVLELRALDAGVLVGQGSRLAFAHESALKALNS